MQEIEHELKYLIPDLVNVSIFQVQCKEIKAYLCEKYYIMSKLLIDMIARRARKSSTDVFQEFHKMQNRLRETPKDIE